MNNLRQQCNVQNTLTDFNKNNLQEYFKAKEDFTKGISVISSGISESGEATDERGIRAVMPGDHRPVISPSRIINPPTPQRDVVSYVDTHTNIIMSKKV